MQLDNLTFKAQAALQEAQHVAHRYSQQLTLDLDKSAKQHLARDSYDPQFGARPLERTIQKKLLDPLSLRLLKGKFNGPHHQGHG